MGSFYNMSRVASVTASNLFALAYRSPAFNTDPHQGSGGHGGNRKPQPNRKDRRKRSKTQRAARRGNR